MTPKAQTRLRDLVDEITRAHEANPAATGAAVDEARRAMRRIVKRAETQPDMERVEFPQTSGPTLCFHGRLIGEGGYQRRSDGQDMSAQLWETSTGQWVATWEGDVSKAAVIDAGDWQGAMDAWGWGDVALTLAKRLGWSLKIEVE